MLTTGDKLLNVMKEEEISIMELSRMSGVPERTIMDILAGIKEPELGVVCRIADGLGICVHELRADEEQCRTTHCRIHKQQIKTSMSKQVNCMFLLLMECAIKLQKLQG